MRQPDHGSGSDVGFADPAFLDLCDALQLRRGAPGRHRRVVTTVRCSVPGASRRVRALARLPRLTVRAAADDSGRLIAGKYAGRVFGVPRHLAVSVLTLAPEVSTMLSGRSRQAARTNVRRARSDGVECRSLPDAEGRVRISDLFGRRGEENEAGAVLDHLDRGVGTVWLAEAAGGDTEAVALVTTAGTFARLDVMKAAPGPNRPARYLLTCELAVALARAGVEHLAVETALFLPVGLRHFQHVLGFVPTTLDVRRDSERAPTRRARDLVSR